MNTRAITINERGNLARARLAARATAATKSVQAYIVSMAHDWWAERAIQEHRRAEEDRKAAAELAHAQARAKVLAKWDEDMRGLRPLVKAAIEAGCEVDEYGQLIHKGGLQPSSYAAFLAVHDYLKKRNLGPAYEFRVPNELLRKETLTALGVFA